MPGRFVDDISAEILDLKKKIGATILAHYYQEGEIQELADFTGDSLKLAREATKVESPVIVFCGVHFMAETAKMLNPSKKVLLPDLQAGCSLSDAARPTSSPATRRCSASTAASSRPYLHQQLRGGEGAVRLGRHVAATPRRSFAQVPADYEILFVPDRHLGRYLQEVTGRKMILWDGSCMVHEIFSVGDLLKHEEAAPEGDDDRAPGVPGEHPRARGLRRRHRGDGQARRRRTRSRRTSWWRPKRT